MSEKGGDDDGDAIKSQTPVYPTVDKLCRIVHENTRLVVVSVLYILLCLWVQNIPSKGYSGACVFEDFVIDLFGGLMIVVILSVTTYTTFYSYRRIVTVSTYGDVIDSLHRFRLSVIYLWTFEMVFGIATLFYVFSYKSLSPSTERILCPVFDVVGFGLIYGVLVCLISMIMMVTRYDQYPYTQRIEYVEQLQPIK